MAWLGKVSLGNFSDIAGAVTKISESVKNIEKNFDTALGLESNPEAPGEGSGIWQSTSDGISLFEPVKSSVGVEGEGDGTLESSNNVEHREKSSLVKKDAPQAKESLEQTSDVAGADAPESEDKVIGHKEVVDLQRPVATLDDGVGEREDESGAKGQAESSPSTDGSPKSSSSEVATEESEGAKQKFSDVSPLDKPPILNSDASLTSQDATVPGSDVAPNVDEGQVKNEMQEAEAKEHSQEKSQEDDEDKTPEDNNAWPNLDNRVMDPTSSGLPCEQVPIEASEDFSRPPTTAEIHDLSSESSNHVSDSSIQSVEAESETKGSESGGDAPHVLNSPKKNDSLKLADPLDYAAKLEKANGEMKMMEAALQGAAKQAQVKADEISKLMNENEKLKSTNEILKKKTTDADNDALREEYHQRVSSLERKVYALTKERDTLRREQNKKSDVAALLKEKDEIINQVMAEGENLSKKQATQEATIRKLRAQIREFEEEKQRLNSKLQVEETKVESIKRDKAATEKLLQETIEKNQSELSAQKEFYTNALIAAKEAEALAETRANSEAKVELENRLRESAEREAMLIQTLDELRQTLSRTERQAVFREEMLQRDINDLQQRYQSSELRYNELITQVPESTRPLLRQIEAMQESAARKAEAWAGVEKSLNSRLEAAEAKTAASEEKEHIINDRMSQALSRVTILETQIACLRTEHAQLNRTLEKERQRASENRQEYLAAMEEVATHKGRTKQLEDEFKELRTKHKQELQEELMHRELLEKELEQLRDSNLDLQRNSQHQTLIDQAAILKPSRSYSENGNLSTQKLDSSGSLGNMEESFFLQASLDSSEVSFTEKKIGGETTVSPYFLKSLTPSAFEAALRQKDGELASYMSRLASLESIRDSLAEELVKMTAQCEKLRGEAAFLPGVRDELEALRRRHSSALELMGERDEELEELRADIVDLKEMYREQIDLLVNKIQVIGSSVK